MTHSNQSAHVDATDSSRRTLALAAGAFPLTVEELDMCQHILGSSHGLVTADGKDYRNNGVYSLSEVPVRSLLSRGILWGRPFGLSGDTDDWAVWVNREALNGHMRSAEWAALRRWSVVVDDGHERYPPDIYIAATRSKARFQAANQLDDAWNCGIKNALRFIKSVRLDERQVG